MNFSIGADTASSFIPLGQKDFVDTGITRPTAANFITSAVKSNIVQNTLFLGGIGILAILLIMNKKPKRKNPKKEVEIIPISVCADCIGYIANSEFSPDLSGKDEKRILSHEKYYTDQGYWIAGGGEDLGFSWQPCELCERPLGGDRYQASLIKG